MTITIVDYTVIMNITMYKISELHEIITMKNGQTSHDIGKS